MNIATERYDGAQGKCVFYESNGFLCTQTVVLLKTRAAAFSTFSSLELGLSDVFLSYNVTSNTDIKDRYRLVLIIKPVYCCSPPALRPTTESELRKGTALSLTSPLRWTQSSNSTATPKIKVSLFYHSLSLFFNFCVLLISALRF